MLSEIFLRSLPRSLGLLIVGLVVACGGQTPPVNPTAAASATPLPPTAATATAAHPPTATPTPTTSPSPTPTPTAAPSPTPGASPSATPLATPRPSPTVFDASALPTLAPEGTDANTGGLSKRAGARLRAALDQQRTSRAIPGMSAAIIFPDGTMWSAGSGNGQLPRQSARNSTPFVVGSITKTFVAAAIMQLDQEGALSIDDPLSSWLPDYPNGGQMTLRQLLNHTAGVFNYFEHSSYNTKVFNTMKNHVWTPDEILSHFGRTPYFAPGNGYHYSNTGFVLLGLVIEEVTGKPLDDVIAERFFTPLGMTDSFFQYETPGPASSAHGYLGKPDGTFSEISDTTNYRPQISAATVAWAAGGIVSSARDMARWADALYGGEGVVGDEALTEMTDYLASSYTRGAYGLGTRTRVYNGARMFGHTGSLRGFSAAMWHYRDLDLTVVVLTNRGRIDANPSADVLAAVAMSVLP